MTDFTYNAPGTVTNPLTPAGMIIFGNGLASTAVGVHGHSNANPVGFADSRAYGSVITTTMTMAQVNGGGDDWFIGAQVNSGPNAGGLVGLYIQSVDCILASFTPAYVKTNIGSSGTTITAGATDVWSVTLTIGGGLITFSNFTQNGSAIVLVGPTTTSTYATEASLAAGGWLDCGNTNNTFFSQFTGQGVVGQPQTGGATIGGNAPTVGRGTVLSPLVARVRQAWDKAGSGLFVPSRKIFLPTRGLALA